MTRENDIGSSIDVSAPPPVAKERADEAASRRRVEQRLELERRMTAATLADSYARLLAADGILETVS